jgi:hypothetical protein
LSFASDLANLPSTKSRRSQTKQKQECQRGYQDFFSWSQLLTTAKQASDLFLWEAELKSIFVSLAFRSSPFGGL